MKRNWYTALRDLDGHEDSKQCLFLISAVISFSESKKNVIFRKLVHQDLSLRDGGAGGAGGCFKKGILISPLYILVPRGRDPFGHHQDSRPLAVPNTGSPRFTDSLSNLTNLIDLYRKNFLRMLKSWDWTEVAILGADQKDRGLWGREWTL